MTNSFSKNEKIKWAVTILTTVAILLIPTNDIFTSQIRTFIAITMCMVLVIAFEFFDYIIPALLLPCLYIITGCCDSTIAFSGWTAEAPIMVLGAYIFANILTEIGLLKRIAYWCILRSPGNFTGLLYGIFFAGFILSVFTSCNAFAVMPALGLGICKALDIKKSKESALIMGAILLSTATVMVIVYNPVTMGLVISSMQDIIPEFQVGWLQYFIQNWPMLIFALLLLALYIKIFKPEQVINGKEYFQAEYDKMGKSSISEKKAAVVTVGLLIYMVTAQWHGLGMQWGFLFAPFIMYCPGMKIGTQSAIRQTNFSMVFFIVACIGIGKVSGSLGMGKMLSDILTPILSNLSNVSILYIIWIFGTITNFIFVPIAILAAFAAPIVQIMMDLGINPLGALYLILIAGDTVILPYESVPYLVVFSFGLMELKDFIKMMIIKLGLMAIFLPIIMIPFWYVIGVL